MVPLPSQGLHPRSSGPEEPLFLPDSFSVPRPTARMAPGVGTCRGAARRVKSETLGMALATAVPPGEENKGPILCVGINSKESSGVSFKP